MSVTIHGTASRWPTATRGEVIFHVGLDGDLIITAVTCCALCAYGIATAVRRSRKRRPRVQTR